jgi:hypothetical protein
MIQDLDRTLERLLRDRVPLRTENITFDVPDDAFRTRLSRTSLTVNLYLYDIRENHDLRSPQWTLERQPDGRVLKERPVVRIDLFYMLTVWSPADPPDVLAEHALLSQILRTLLRYPTIPPDVLQGALIGQEPPLPTLVAQPDGLRNPAEFWGALRQPPRPGVHLVVTIAVQPSALSDEPLSLTPVISRGLVFGPGEGRVYRMGVRPPLSRRYEHGTQLRQMAITPLPAARLQSGVFAGRDVIRIVQVRQLPSYEWVLIDDAVNPEFVRLGEVTGPGTQEVAVTPPVRFAHDPTATPIPLRRATAPASDLIVTSLDAQANAGVDTLRVAQRENVAVDDVLLISEEAQTEVVQVVTVTVGTDAGDIRVRPTLRFAHRSNRNLYRRLLEPAPQVPAAATRLAQPVAQLGSPIVLDSNVAQGVVLMVGTGPNVEFCRLDTAATAGMPVAVSPPLQSNHPANTPLRQLTEAEVLGRLQVEAPVGSREVIMVGEAAAVEGARRRERPLLSAGEILQLDDPMQPIAFQIIAITETPGAFLATPEEFFAIGGWVTDNTTPPNPVVGAQVVLRESGLAATTDVEGRFAFANLPRGSYNLQVTAPGYQDANKGVQVPADSVDEYRVALSP